MILLVSGATATVRAQGLHPNLGQLITPANWGSIQLVADGGLLWAADNACFKGLDPDAYMTMLDRLTTVDRSRLQFVAVPDVVADHHVTAAMFTYWLPALERRKLPAAFVAQDGCRPDLVPWDDIAALFIGGSTRWKLSKAAALLIRHAKRRGLWVHVGRVNALARMRYFQALGADSCDGSQFSMFPERWIPWALEFLENNGQLSMMGVQLYA